MDIAAPDIRRHDERGFSIIEVIVAVVVLAVVVGGATAVFGSSTSATSAARVRDKQTAVANEAMAKMQADASWALECRRRQTPFNPSQPDCDLTQWISTQPALRTIGQVVDADGSRMTFRVHAIATGVDLTADGRAPNDADGVVPDLYRLRVTIAPEGTLAQRYPRLKATTIQQETNPTIRVQTGRVTVNACLVTNQVDERAAAGDCTGSARSADLLPPGALDTSSSTRIRQTCVGTVSMSGSDQRDCTAYKCAEKAIASPNPGLVQPCAAHDGWDPSIFSGNWSEQFTSMMLAPASGSVVLRNRADGRTWSKPLNSGTAQFTDLPVGIYQVQFVPPGYRPWRSKSVPSSGDVAVEAGLNSRAVLMYRPVGRATVRVKVRTVDGSGPPWVARTLPGYVSLAPDGSIMQGGREEIRLVPVPQGRLLDADKPATMVVQSTSTTEFVFRNVEPGLYSFELSDPAYRSFKPLQHTAGFIYVFPNGSVFTGFTSQLPEFVNGTCAKNVRDAWVANGPVRDPVSGQVWVPTPCDAPAGAAPPGGGGGGGTS